MGIKNFLIEGVSGSGKTSVCDELQRRGFRAVHGDRELAYQGDPETGQVIDGTTPSSHDHHLWDLEKLRDLVASRDNPITFFCGGSRNFSRFLSWFDGVFILEVDLDTLLRRLATRAENEFGGREEERQFIVRVHQTKEDLPEFGIPIDAARPIARVVDEILRLAK